MILEALSLVGVSFLGTVVWVLSPEATAMLYGSQDRMPAVVVGGLCALGQGSMLALLYYMGGELTERWAWMRKKVERTRNRFEKQLNRSFLWMSVSAGIVGIPPAIAISALAKGFGMRLFPFLFCIVAGRFARFTFLAASGEKAMEFFATYLNSNIWTSISWHQLASF